jgi:hypothetical protein
VEEAALAVERSDPGRAPGWRRDPWRRFTGRYWDGNQWTEHVVDARRHTSQDPVPEIPPPDDAGRAGARRRRRQGAVIAVAGAALVAAGSFLPWGEIKAPFVGTVRVSGAEGGDGFISLGLAGAVALIAVMAYRSAPETPARFRFGMAALVVGLVILTTVEVVDTITTITELSASSPLIRTSAGVGLWLLGLGSATTAVAWFRIPWAAVPSS